MQHIQKVIGYARVSTPSQNLDRQIGALRSAGCHTIFRDKASGKAVRNRPQLERAIDSLSTGDILIVAEWDRATRSMMDGINIMQRIAERGAADGRSVGASAGSSSGRGSASINGGCVGMTCESGGGNEGKGIPRA